MQTISLQSNTVFVEQRPTTQEDNYGSITDRWEVYLTNNDDSSIVGMLIKYQDGRYAFFIKMLRFEIQPNQVIFR